jgi:hypothetical protein
MAGRALIQNRAPTLCPVQLSRRSQQKFADLAADRATIRQIAHVYETYDFELPLDFEAEDGRARRSVCEAAEAGADIASPAVADRLLRVYVAGIEDWGRKPPGFDTYALIGTRPPNAPPEDLLWDNARALVRSLRRDGAPIDEDGYLVFGATPPVLPIERFDRLAQPRVLLDHLGRIEAGTDADPAAAIASAKELLESTCKFVLDDYGIAYSRSASLPDLYKAVATELRISRDAVPHSAKGSQAAQRVLQNLMTAVQNLAELRNELGLGHGRTEPSPALARHARLAANAARTIVEFILETWHERKAVDATGPAS